MARVRLIHWNGPEGRELKLRLASMGHQADFDDLERLTLQRIMRGDLPEAFVIDLSRLPSQGREFAMSVRTSKTMRHVPIVFVDGDPVKVAKLKPLLPDATYTTWPKLATALPTAIARPVKSPVVPPSSIYTGKPVGEKLGVKPHIRVCLIGAPKGFAEALATSALATSVPPGDLRPSAGPPSLPPTSVPPSAFCPLFTAKPTAACELFIVFVRSRREFFVQLEALARHVTRQTLWVAWPKKASGVKSDLDGNVVRDTGLAGGWVDFKVCSLDDTWSGLAFKRRK